MPVTFTGDDLWHADVDGPTLLDDANGTEISDMGKLILDNVFWLKNRVGGRYVVASLRTVQVTDPTSAYAGGTSTTGSSWIQTTVLDTPIAVQADDIVVAIAQVNVQYSGTGFGEARLRVGKTVSTDGPHARVEPEWGSGGAEAGHRTVTLMCVHTAPTTEPDLTAAVYIRRQTDGTVSVEGSALLLVAVLREVA